MPTLGGPSSHGDGGRDHQGDVRMVLAAVVAAFSILGMLSSVHSVMHTRTSQGSIAWALSLLTFPYLAVPLYWIFGRNKFQGYVMARRVADTQTVAVAQEAIDTTQPYRLPPAERVDAVLAAESLAGMPVLGGNEVTLLIDGAATFESIFAGIDAARDYVLVQFFIIHDDDLGRELKAHMVAQARAGVRVFLLYDEIGCHALPRRYLKELRDAGAEVRAFHSQKGPRNRFQINFRNHRKIVVTDGEVAWIGGHNVGDEYMGRDPKFGHWRDTHMRLEGPAVLKAQLSFLEDWHWATEQTPPLRWAAHRAPEGRDVPVLVMPTGPADTLDTASLMFVHAIHSAQDRIWIASPYFIPDESVTSALQLAGLRGVDVRILVPDRPDHLLVYFAAYAYFDEACKTGAKVYRYTDGFLHQKAMLIDDAIAAIGTANFDNRSFRLNFEITTLVSDPKFAAEVEAMFETDFAHAREMENGEFERKPWYFRLAVRAARLTAPLL